VSVIGLEPNDGFDPVDRRLYVLGVKTCAEIPLTVGSDPHDPWQIAGETSAAPDGTNVDGGAYHATGDPLDTEPGHVWPFMNLGATMRSNLSPAGYFPACRSKEGINHYRRCVRLAPRMFGSDGRLLAFRLFGRLKATNAANVLDLILPVDLVTALPTTTLVAGKHVAIRLPLGNLGANEVGFSLTVEGQPIGPRRSLWEARLRVAAQTNPGTSNPALDLVRGPFELDLTATGPDMDTTGGELGFLFAARRSTAIAVDAIGTAGGAAQDGSEVYVKVGAASCFLFPGA
jgi:hypothetical protein